MNENMDVQFIISETTRICLGVGRNSRFPRESQRVGAAVSVLCDIHTTLCAVSKLHLHTILTFLVVVQTILGQCRRAGVLCVRQLQIAM